MESYDVSASLVVEVFLARRGRRNMASFLGQVDPNTAESSGQSYQFPSFEHAGKYSWSHIRVFAFISLLYFVQSMLRLHVKLTEIGLGRNCSIALICQHIITNSLSKYAQRLLEDPCSCFHDCKRQRILVMLFKD